MRSALSRSAAALFLFSFLFSHFFSIWRIWIRDCLEQVCALSQNQWSRVPLETSKDRVHRVTRAATWACTNRNVRILNLGLVPQRKVCLAPQRPAYSDSREPRIINWCD